MATHLRRISTRKRRTKVVCWMDSNKLFLRWNKYHRFIYFYLFKIIKEQVGFSSLPEQVHRKSLKKGFEFTLLVIGDSGLGKSTLVNSLFMTELYSDRCIDTANGS